MELFIAAGIAGAGWLLSKNKVDATDLKVDRPESYPFAAEPAKSGDLLKQQQRVSDARWTESQKSGSGIIHPNATPFFRSVRTQGTNPTVSQRRMEQHTGTLSDTWRHKVESGPRFAMQSQPVQSGGTSGNSVAYDVSRQRNVTHIQNNTLPFEKVRVGPGVGIGPDVPAADGFHSQYRIMPVDPFSYKHNSLEGRTNAGGALVAAREVDPKFYSKGVPRFYDMDRRPLEQSRAAATGPAQREDFTRGSFPGCHVTGSEYFGTAGAISHNVRAGDFSRNKNDDRPGQALTNATGQRAGVGAYTAGVQTYDPAKITSQQREVTTGYTGALTGNARRPQAQNTFIANPTNRDISLSAYVSGAKHVVPTGEIRPGDMPMRTLKESIHDHTNGDAAMYSSVKAATVQCTDRQLLKASKRGSYVANTYVATPERTDAFARANGAAAHDCGRIGKVGVRVRVSENRQMSHGATQSMYVNQAMPGENTTLARNKLPVHNTQTDFGISRAALEGNELAIKIN